MIEAGTCIHIGDPCTDSYRDCDAGLICDNDKDNEENYCKKPNIGISIRTRCICIFIS